MNEHLIGVIYVEINELKNLGFFFFDGFDCHSKFS